MVKKETEEERLVETLVMCFQTTVLIAFFKHEFGLNRQDAIHLVQQRVADREGWGINDVS